MHANRTERMDARKLSDITSRALEAIDVPRALDNWRDEIEGAASLGIARMLANNAQAVEPELIAAARNAARDEIKSELRRRGATVARSGRVDQPPAHYEPMPDDIQDVGEVGVGDDPPLSLATLELAQRGRAEIERLPSALRAVMMARYVAGLTQAQAATQLGVSQGTIARREARALARLRQAMADEQEHATRGSTPAGTRSRGAGVPSRSQQGHTP